MDLDFNMFQDMLNNQSQRQEKGVYAEFYDKTIKTEEVNEKGFPIFKSKVYVKIETKDNRDVFNQPATDEYIRRFPVEYNRYLLNKKEAVAGTPLNQFAFLTGAQYESCKYHGIFTVERLAELSDEQTEALDLNNEREAARKFIAISKNNAIIADFGKKEKEYKAEIKKLKEQIKELQAAKKEVKED